MRTTITLDDDLSQVLERKAEEARLSFKEVLNLTLRRGLAAEQISAAAPKPIVVTKPFPFQTKSGIDYTKMNQLSDELEVEAFLEKAARDGFQP